MTFLSQDSSRSLTLGGEKSVSGPPAPEAEVRPPVLPRGMQALLKQESRHPVTLWARKESHPDHSVSYRASFKGQLRDG